MSKGAFGGECNRTACTHPTATWYNSSTRKYYCQDCAGLINYWSRLDIGKDVCKPEQPDFTLDDKEWIDKINGSIVNIIEIMPQEVEVFEQDAPKCECLECGKPTATPMSFCSHECYVDSL